MQASPPQRKQCLEVTGGRLTYQATHEMPGLSMQIYSRNCGQCADGGGEVHYVSSCASGRITRMLLADICGTKDTFKKLSCEMRDGLIRSINSIWQDRVIADVSQTFRHFADRGGLGTASVATFFAPTRNFAMCNIGYPPPLVYRCSQHRWEVLHGESDPNAEPGDSFDGVYGEDEYRHISTKLEVGDVFVLYGNGFACSAFPGGGIVGHKRLLDALQDSPHADPDARLSHLIRLVQDELTPQEDSTVLVCRVTKTRVRLLDNLLAPLRLFRRPADHTELL